MVTLWPIPEEAREALEDGDHVLLELPPHGSKVVIGFEEHVADEAQMCEWEVENSWKELMASDDDA